MDMKQLNFRCMMTCGNALNRFLKPSNVKNVEEVPLFLSEKFLLVSFTNAGVVANGLSSPPAMAQKALSMSISKGGSGPESWRGYFIYF